jgi:hypothetical protein
VRDYNDQSRLVVRGACNEPDREGVALEHRPPDARFAGPGGERARVIGDAPGYAGELVEKRVANGWAAARQVVACLVLKLSGGLVQKVDAEQAAGHLALGSEAFKNRLQVTPLRSTRQASVDLCSPGLRPLLGREVLLVRSLDLLGENSPKLG